MSAKVTAPGSREFLAAISQLTDRQVEAACALFDRAEMLGYDANECAAQRWYCWMLLGRFEDAWRESDRIAARGAPDPHRFWDGRPFSGERVLIRCLHGFGDAIQFIRYTRLLKQNASRIIVQTHPELVALLQGTPGVGQVVSWPTGPEKDIDGWDRQIELMELPRAFRTTLETIPAGAPYLRVPGEYRSHARVSEPRRGNQIRIGLQWGSSAWNPARSIPLQELLPVFALGGMEFYSFQRGEARDELKDLAPGFRISDVSGESPEVVEAAADLLNIDLLITVDTMLAHLAGALGRPVWVLLPFEADWRWMLHRRDSPWYPTMRLFRQPSPGDWSSAVRLLVSELLSVRASADIGQPLALVPVQ